MGPECIRFTFAFIFAALVPSHWARSLSKKDSPRAFKLELIRSFPHEGRPFTQGLEISDDGHHLVESSGSYPPGTESFIRLIDPVTGQTVRSLKDGIDSSYFSEGIVQGDNKHWYMSTYTSKKVMEYDKDLNFIAEHTYPEVGWGLTRTTDGSSFLATNGSEHIMTLQKGTFEVIDAKAVTCMGKSVGGLNELEMVDDFMGQGPTLLGNVYLSRLVLAVNPANGQCTGVFDLGELQEPIDNNEGQGFHVANGLAYNKTSGTLFVTGKNWDQMFEVRVQHDADGTALPMLQRHILSHPVEGENAMLLQHVSSTGDSFRISKQHQQTPQVIKRNVLTRG